MPALTPRHAETAAHFASGLGAHAKGAAIPVRNHHRLHTGATAHAEKVLLRTVGGTYAAKRRAHSQFVELREFGSTGLRDVGHLVEAADTAFIEPLRQLLPCE